MCTTCLLCWKGPDLDPLSAERCPPNPHTARALFQLPVPSGWNCQMDILEHLKQAGGVARTAQLLDAGYSRRDIARLTQRGAHQPKRGVFLAPNCNKELAAASHHNARLTCASAAPHYGLWLRKPPTQLHLACNHGHGAGFIRHRSVRFKGCPGIPRLTGGRSRPVSCGGRGPAGRGAAQIRGARPGNWAGAHRAHGTAGRAGTQRLAAGTRTQRTSTGLSVGLIQVCGSRPGKVTVSPALRSYSSLVRISRMLPLITWRTSTSQSTA